MNYRATILLAIVLVSVGLKGAKASGDPIPIILHVIHKQDNTGLLSATEIEDQLEVLNSSFPGYEFQYAAVIFHEDDSLFDWGTWSTSEYDQWVIDPEHYLNVFTGDGTNTGLYGIVAWGDPTTPTPGSQAVDFVFVTYQTFPGGTADPGASGNETWGEGHTLVHEVGHYFTLKHTFENGCASKASAIPDTITDDVREWFDFEEVGDVPPSCTGESYDPVDNPMMYTSDLNRAVFYSEQVDRIDEVYGDERDELGRNLGTLTIPSGDSVQLEDAMVYLAEDYEILVEGELDATTTTFTALDTDWKGITFGVGSNGGEFYGVTVEKVNNPSGNVITVEDGLLTLHSSTVINNTGSTWWGVHVTWAGEIDLEDSYINSPNGHALLVSGVTQFSVTNTDFRTTGATYAGIAINAGGWGQVQDSEFEESGQSVRLSYSGSRLDGNDGDNQFCSSGSTLVYADTGTTVNLEDNYWPSGGPTTSGSGTIDVSPSSTGASCSLGAAKMTSAPIYFGHFDSETSEAEGLVRQASKELHSGDVDLAEALLVRAFEVGDSETAVRSALSGLALVYKRTGSLGALSTIEVASQNPVYEAQALQLLVSVHSVRGDARALSNLTTLTERHPVTRDLFFAQLSASFLFKTEGNLKPAANLDSFLDQLKPVTDADKMLMDNLYRTAGNREGTPERRLLEVPAKSSSELVVNAYPNPFNPEINFSFETPRSGRVTMKLFDIGGRLVATIKDETMSAGQHYVSFNAGALPSGQYVYSLSHSGTKRVSGVVILSK